jgi:glycosyltransferase A (GT-A) superfamily protein (DUF2064 family)
MLLADGTPPAPPGVERFGRCLLHAIRSLLALGHTAACVLNADSPTLPTRLLLEAHAILSQPGDRLVMGAAEDGGYYLLGMKRAHAHVLSDIDWSTAHVAEQTRQRARQADLAMIELDPWYDVDDPDSLHRLVEDLSGPSNAQGAFPAPHSTARLKEYGLLAEALAGTAA